MWQERETHGLPLLPISPPVADNGEVSSRRPSPPTGSSRPGSPVRAAARASASTRKLASRPARTNRPGPHVEFRRGNGTVSISWRAVVFVLVLAVAFVLVTPTLRHFLRQEEAERRLGEELVAAQTRTAELEREIARWDDPEYVRAQARDRLGYVMPGQQAYIVVDPEAVIGEEAQQAYEIERGIATPTGPWHLELWDSIVVAGTTPAAGTSQKDDTITVTEENQ